MYSIRKFKIDKDNIILIDSKSVLCCNKQRYCSGCMHMHNSTCIDQNRHLNEEKLCLSAEDKTAVDRTLRYKIDDFLEKVDASKSIEEVAIDFLEWLGRQ